MAIAVPEHVREQGYRAFMRCDARDGWFVTVEDQIATWLRNKKHWDVDVTVDEDHYDDSRSLHIRHHRSTSGQDIRMVLVERGTETGTWTTDLIGHDQPGLGDWITLMVSNDRGRFADVPVLARYLMQALPLGDGSIEFRDEPRVLSEGDIPRLLEVLGDSERHGLVFAAGTDDHAEIPLDRFTKQVMDWTRQVFGLAQVVVLDPTATERLLHEVGLRHAVPAWTIRTYFPGLRTDSVTDARRNKILGTRSLAELTDGRVRTLLGRVARDQAAARLLPSDVLRVWRAFERIENRRVVAPSSVGTAKPSLETVADVEPPFLLEQPFPPPSSLPSQSALFEVPAADEALLARLKPLGRLPRAAVQAFVRMQRQIDKLQAQFEAREDKLRQAQVALDDSQEMESDLLDELEAASKRSRWLSKKLLEAGDTEAALGDAPAEDLTSPEDFGQLVGLLSDGALRGVKFTGDEKVAKELSEYDTLQTAVRTCWEACRVLADYARAREAGDFDGGVHQYLTSPKVVSRGYRTISASRHAAAESEACMKRFGDTRIFPVPKEVDPSGFASMQAHFKLAQIGMVSPRMYYLDCWSRNGWLYIGYIGPHLPNTQTN